MKGVTWEIDLGEEEVVESDADTEGEEEDSGEDDEE